MNELTQQDYQNILGLISQAQITGKDAMTVALLQQKIAKLLKSESPVTPPEPVEPPKKK